MPAIKDVFPNKLRLVVLPGLPHDDVVARTKAREVLEAFSGGWLRVEALELPSPSNQVGLKRAVDGALRTGEQTGVLVVNARGEKFGDGAKTWVHGLGGAALSIVEGFRDAGVPAALLYGTLFDQRDKPYANSDLLERVERLNALALPVLGDLAAAPVLPVNDRRVSRARV